MRVTGFTTGVAMWLLAGGMVTGVQAEVRTITINTREPAVDGKSFADIGPYQQITGIATGEIDPTDPQNAVITDIDLAPQNERGMVEYRTTFAMHVPVDMSKASGVLFYNIVNRGNRNGPNTWGIGRDPADGFLHDQGQILLWSGWQGDMPIATVGPDQEGIDVPIAISPDGSPVTGRVVERFDGIPRGANIADAISMTTQSLTGAGRMPLTLDTKEATLVSAVSETPSGLKSGVKTIPGSEWAFADCRITPFPGTPSPEHICIKSGFDPELLYELTYTARDPYVLGVGMAAMRDVVSFFRYSEQDSAGVQNPLFDQVSHVVAMGNSQSGRFAKAFLNLGFNEDEQGRIVWDGLNTRIAGMMGSFNTRFGEPGDIAELYMPGAEGPLWWDDYVDEVRGLPAWGILHRCSASNTCPKITETYGGPEFWYSRGTVGIAGTKGTEDLPLPDNVRRYYHASTSHGGGSGGFNIGTPSSDPLVFVNNPNPQIETDRALYVALVEWVVNGTMPPPSAYPRVSDDTLVPANSIAMGWPDILGAPRPDGVVNPVLDYDFGPQYRYLDSSGVMTVVPPRVKQVIPTLVPKVDADGNDLAGLTSLLLRMPLGTYTGWNPIGSGPLMGRERSLAGGYIPFAKTRAERLANEDPRLSIEERYPSLQAYYDAATREAAELVDQRLLLPEDAARLLQQILDDMQRSQLLPARLSMGD